MIMKKQKFIPDIWVIFNYQNITGIGRTFTNLEKEELVAFTTEKAKCKTILFSEITDVRKLNILSQQKKVYKETSYSLN